jgi:hypothetical protein
VIVVAVKVPVAGVAVGGLRGTMSDMGKRKDSGPARAQIERYRAKYVVRPSKFGLAGPDF